MSAARLAEIRAVHARRSQERPDLYPNPGALDELAQAQYLTEVAMNTDRAFVEGLLREAASECAMEETGDLERAYRLTVQAAQRLRDVLNKAAQ